MQGTKYEKAGKPGEHNCLPTYILTQAVADALAIYTTAEDIENDKGMQR